MEALEILPYGIVSLRSSVARSVNNANVNLKGNEEKENPLNPCAL